MAKSEVEMSVKVTDEGVRVFTEEIQRLKAENERLHESCVKCNDADLKAERDRYQKLLKDSLQTDKWNSYPICPHCESTLSDPCLSIADGDEKDVNCHECGKGYMILCCMPVEYMTYQKRTDTECEK